MKEIKNIYNGSRAFVITDEKTLSTDGKKMIRDLSRQFFVKAHVIDDKDNSVASTEDLRIVNFLLKNKVKKDELIINFSGKATEEIVNIASFVNLNDIMTYNINRI